MLAGALAVAGLSLAAPTPARAIVGGEAAPASVAAQSEVGS